MSDIDVTSERPWTLEAVQDLIAMAREGVPAEVISLKMKRSLGSIHGKLSELGLSARVESGVEGDMT